MLLINVKDEKRRLRKHYRKLRENCPAELKARLDKALTAQVLSLDEFKSCETVFVFISSPIECDTSEIISEAFRQGKKVAVPRCIDKFGKMDFYYIESTADLSPGSFSLMEPDPVKCKKVTDFTKGLCIVPGLCFDYEGYRVGFGKGYYDRFLNVFRGTTVGICYSRYTEKQLPRGAHDRHTDILVTEKFTNRMVKRYMNGKLQ